MRQPSAVLRSTTVNNPICEKCLLCGPCAVHTAWNVMYALSPLTKTFEGGQNVDVLVRAEHHLAARGRVHSLYRGIPLAHGRA